jgi:hypothetical protein
VCMCIYIIYTCTLHQVSNYISVNFVFEKFVLSLRPGSMQTKGSQMQTKQVLSLRSKSYPMKLKNFSMRYLTVS